MPHCLSPASCLPLIGRLRRHPPSRESQNERPHTMSICSLLSTCSSSRVSQLQRVIKAPSTAIHDLDDDSLLHLFNLLRPSLFERDEDNIIWKWDGQRWWYKLAQVCRRWRHLVLGSASHLRLFLVCTPGTPVADMLAHSPPFPLVIGCNYSDDELTTEDEEGIMLALRHRDRVRLIFIEIAVLSLKRLLPAMNDDFPALEYLHIGPPAKHDTHFTLPPTFQAPYLRNLWISHFTSAIGSPLLSTAIGLVTLTLEWTHPSTYPHPNNFLEQLSLLPHLEEINFGFRSSVPNRDIERQISQAPITIHIIHPNLRFFSFVGVSGFLEAILPHMAAPFLETFIVQFSNQLRFSVPHLVNFMMNAEKFRSSRVKFTLHHQAVVLFSYTPVGATSSNFHVGVSCRHLDWQVSSMTQISNVLRPLFSDVVDLTLDYREHTLSSEQHNQANHTHWREILESFRNVKILRVHNGLIGEVSRALKLDGEQSLEILPELKELICPTRCVDDKIFAPFIREREVARQPVNLVGVAIPVPSSLYYHYSPAGIIEIGPDSVTSQ